MVLRMLQRLKMLNEIELNVVEFYNITDSIYSIQIYQTVDAKLLSTLSKIWSAIFNGSRNKIQIDSMDKLIRMAAIFSIDLTRKLKKVDQDFSKFKLTMNKKQRLYIIYFTLVAYPLMDYSTIESLHSILTQLQDCVQNYMENPLLKGLCTENQNLIIQYYFKSLATLNTRSSSQNQKRFHGLRWFLSKNPFFKLHRSYLASNYLLSITENLKMREQLVDSFFSEVNNIIIHLIEGFSFWAYINKLQTEHKLYIYEKVKSEYLTIINEDFINRVFFESESHLLHVFDDHTPEIFKNNIYNRFKQVLASTIRLFNESNYFDKTTAKSLFGLFYNDCSRSFYIPPSLYDTPLFSDTPIVSRKSGESNYGMPIESMLRWFTLIYEMKFVFGDIKSKFTNFNFM
ncbi:hypothetical protein RF11_01055 [Thelohanellus kitauei]|uniref:Uncharacterized protein n=1 Tax=Thelohanellus kitauei TaxID=669202 RepID=A0A0C2MM58_THEKT|nr:hypothetical protein RF11_01055 [Thelohanellus kitauei]